jgi:hypothetical protein
LPFLKELSAIGISVISSSALHPAGRGAVEKMVGTSKMLIKKILATKPEYNWELIPFIVSKAINNVISTQTNFRPSEMVFGKLGAGENFLELEAMAPPNHFVQNSETYIKQITEEIKESTKLAAETLTLNKMALNEKLNQSYRIRF